MKSKEFEIKFLVFKDKIFSVFFMLKEFSKPILYDFRNLEKKIL